LNIDDAILRQRVYRGLLVATGYKWAASHWSSDARKWLSNFNFNPRDINSMAPIPIYRPEPGRRMRVACFMSGSGTNARLIIERSLQHGSSYRVELIFTDVKDETLDSEGKKVCKALDIAREHGIAYKCVDIMDFYGSRGHTSKKDLSLRPDFDKQIVATIEKHRVDLIALAGYMSITTKPLLDRYDGRMINVHPADLSIVVKGERKYVGIHTVRDAILEGEKEIRATTHVVREKVDNGEILLLSKPVAIKLPSGVTLDKLRKDKDMLKFVVEAHQDRLKREGDWVIYPLTIQMIGEGSFALDDGVVYLNEKPVPNGLRL
jgi:phosphoribosylglycinamide formyltransferase-1